MPERDDAAAFAWWPIACSLIPAIIEGRSSQASPGRM